MPLAKSITSGVTPNVSAAKGRPVRPMPVCTSSKISRMPCAVAALPQPGQPATRRHHVAALAEDGLHDHRADVGARRLQVQQLVEPVESRRRGRSCTDGSSGS